MSARRNNWTRWGEGDEIGTLNMLGAAEVADAARLVRRGAVFSLGLPLQANRPAHGHRPPIMHFMAVDGGDFAAGARAPGGLGYADDYVFLPVHGATTHIDALSHVWTEGMMFNGYSSDCVRSSGAARLSIDAIPPIVGRGVLLDIAGLHGVEVLEPTYGIGAEDLAAAARKAAVEIRGGDIILVRTGLGGRLLRDGIPAERSQAGLVRSAVPWLVEKDVAVVGADNLAVELIPDPEGANMPLHVMFLRDYGVHLIELLMLEQLAAERVYEFLFIAAPLPIRRAVGSPLSPIAVI